jgi:hypothetical protein
MLRNFERALKNDNQPVTGHIRGVTDNSKNEFTTKQKRIKLKKKKISKPSEKPAKIKKKSNSIT